MIKLKLVDGNNVAFTNTNGKLALISNLEILNKSLEESGCEYIIFVRESLKYRIDNKEKLELMILKGSIQEIPSSFDDDDLMIQIAKKENAMIITNDKFRNYYSKYGKTWIRSIRIEFKIYGSSIYFSNNIFHMTNFSISNAKQKLENMIE